MPKKLAELSARLDARLFTAWNVLLVIVASFSSFAIPFSLATEESASLFRRREIVLTTIYLIDILISMYRLKKRVSVVHVEYSAMRSFFLRWIWLDILSALPLTAMFGLPWLQIVRLAKMVKVIYLLQILRRTQANIANLVLIAQMVYWIAIATHWLSCGWLVIRGFDHDLDLTTNYVNALYWTSMTLTTVGFGDITPVSNTERLYAIATMFFGYSFFGYLIGSFASILTKRDPIKEKYRQNMEKLINAARYANLPLDLQQQIHSYYQYQMTRRVGYDEESFINDLPAGLRGEVSLHFRKEVIEDVAIFEDAPQ
ncbi:MAG: ion channel, partial [Bacteroidota bacterium]